MSSSTVDLPDEVRERVFLALEKASGRPFTPYLWEPFAEALHQRMALTHISDVQSYLEQMEANKEEALRLEDEALIGVTSFFRNPEAFRALRRQIISRILPLKCPGGTLRVWIPGCSTGEEAYSLTMLLREINEKTRQNLTIRVVATDINARAIARARAGVYRNSSARSIPSRFHHYFRRDQDAWAARDIFDENLLFCVQDIFAPSPFRQLDLISCRNVLIYFHPRYQTRALAAFEKSLRPGGLLFLGRNEHAISASDSFALIDPFQKIFRRRRAR